MTKPRLVKVRALLYILQNIKKRGCAYFDTAPFFVGSLNCYCLNSEIPHLYLSNMEIHRQNDFKAIPSDND